MKYCKLCDKPLSDYEEMYLKDICTWCIDENGLEDDIDYSDIEELDFNE